MLDHARPPGHGFEDRLGFDSVVASLAARLNDVPLRDVDQEIQNGLQQVCELLDLELAVVWQWSIAAPDVILPTHTFSAQDGPSPAGPMRQEHYPWSRQQVLAGRAFAVGSVDELPAEAAVDRETCRRIGIKSAVCVPLSVGGSRPVGALGFNSLREERRWPDELVAWLRLVGQLIAGALARQRHELALRESEERVRLAAESAGAGLWTLEYDTGLFWVSEEARVIFGFRPDEQISLDFLKSFIHPADLDRVLGTIEHSRAVEELVEVDYRIVDAGGSVRWITSRARRRSGAGVEQDRLMGVSIDITGRKLAEENYRKSEGRLASATSLAGLGFYEVDLETGAAYLDERFSELCGVQRHGVVDLDVLQYWMEHLHPDDRDGVLQARAQLHCGAVERVLVQYRYLHPERGVLWLHHEAGVTRRDAGGKAVATFGVLRDITDRKQLELELRDLSLRLIRAHEEERALLARELHDDVTQRLAIMAIGLSQVELATKDPAQVQALVRVREEVVRLSEDVHSLAYQLHPSVLEQLGLAQALEAECERLARNEWLDVTMEVEPHRPEVDRDAALCLFRVAQEALSNVRRHSGRREAKMTLGAKDAGLLLTVSDDGSGFALDRSGRPRSLGLASMRERVLVVGGALEIDSAPGSGTKIAAWVPGGGDRS